MQYIIKEYEKYEEEEILSLYQSVGWVNYINNPIMLKNAFEHSLKIYAAYIDNKVIGIIRIVGDGYSVILIQDILVYPEYQREGIGTALLQHVLEEYNIEYKTSLCIKIILCRTIVKRQYLCAVF